MPDRDRYKDEEEGSSDYDDDGSNIVDSIRQSLIDYRSILAPHAQVHMYSDMYLLLYGW